MRPTRVLPVKLIFLMAGSAMSCCVMAGALAGSWKMRFTTPAGRPASWRTEQRPHMVRGHASEPLRMAVLPAAMGNRHGAAGEDVGGVPGCGVSHELPKGIKRKKGKQLTTGRWRG